MLIIGGENSHPQDIEEIVCALPPFKMDDRSRYGVYNPSLGTEVVVVGAEVEREESLADAITLEQAIRSRVLSGLGISVRTILLKPPAGRFDAQKNPRPAS